jgi:hypothetical protein
MRLLLGLFLAWLARKVLTSRGLPAPASCTHCAAPICASCGLHAQSVTVGAGFCSRECAETKPENRRINTMRGGVLEEVQYL